MAQLRAFVDDSHAFYYYTRAKAHAALMYATRAMRVHARRRDWPHVAKCHLHSAAILSKLRRHAEAARCLGQVLHLVETGELDDRGDAPHKLCLVAVTHHNIAVEQLLLHHVEEAVVSARGRAPVRPFVPSTPRGPTRAREREASHRGRPTARAPKTLLCSGAGAERASPRAALPLLLEPLARQVRVDAPLRGRGAVGHGRRPRRGPRQGPGPRQGGPRRGRPPHADPRRRAQGAAEDRHDRRRLGPGGWRVIPPAATVALPGSSDES
mmetsp:Transcript_14652/g.47387  ORF Transcript_14652/g.47387 Transcript_14652/m.47387 type:complete len:268 (-) Transcript_14652:301-1104(-)